MGKKNKGKKGKKQQNNDKQTEDDFSTAEMDLAAEMVGLSPEQKNYVKENAKRK